MPGKLKLLALFILGCTVLLPGDLVDTYKKGEIKLIGDPNFAQGTDWESLFYDTAKDLAVGPDGTIFVANQSQHNISKFDKNGRLIKTFGREGQGPGDLLFPAFVSILDNRYLVVADIPHNRKMSVFNLEGDFVKVVRLEKPAFCLVSLKDNKVAYLTWLSVYEGDTKETWKRTTVFIKDIAAGTETEVATYLLREASFLDIGRLRTSLGINYRGEVCIDRAKGGNLLVGVSTYPVITIFNLKGKEIKSFPLLVQPLAVTNKFFKEFQQDQTKKFCQSSGLLHLKNIFMKRISIKKDFFEKHLPYYKKFVVDSEGNILVFKYTASYKEDKDIFQVYSPEGKYICETIVNRMGYALDIDNLRWHKKIQFTRDAVYGLLELENSEDISLRIVRVGLDQQ